jgi:hypothetical protein
VHSANIAENSDVALVIYDSTVPEGHGFGVYMRAEAEMVEKKTEIAKALRLLYTRKSRPIPSAGLFVGETPRKVYRATPSRAWINDIGSKADELKNIRTEIELE